MALYLRGIHLHHKKATKNSPVLRMDAPKTVTIPVSMHIGKPAVPVVKVGDLVKVGTKIAEADGYISANVYSSVSGKVTKLQEHVLHNGTTSTSVVIESDGQMTPDESVTPPVVTNKQEFIDAVKKSGIVGLGGAGFPAHVKLDVEPKKADCLLINGSECEPFITSDTVTMLTRADDMVVALDSITRYLGIKQVIIGIEKSNKSAIAAMKKMAESIKDYSVSVKALPNVYPQGGEKVLIYHTTGRKVPVKKLPVDVGCIVLNCTTLASIGTYLRTGMPLVEKCVTVEGGAVKHPQNVIAPIGTKLGDLFEFCGGFTEEPAKIIYGGPMMGITVPDVDSPIIKNTNAILALSKKQVKQPKTTECIRCGACVNTCPFGLEPTSIAEAYEKNNTEMLMSLSVMTCMECGCCSYVCPANRPLVQINKLSKQKLNEAAKKEGAK